MNALFYSWDLGKRGVSAPGQRESGDLHCASDGSGKKLNDCVVGCVTVSKNRRNYLYSTREMPVCGCQ